MGLSCIVMLSNIQNKHTISMYQNLSINIIAKCSKKVKEKKNGTIFKTGLCHGKTDY